MSEQRQVDGSPSRQGLLHIVRRRLGLVLVCALLAPGAALGYSLSQPTEYTASAQLLFRNPGFDTAILGSPFFAPESDAARQAATNLKLVALAVVADRTAAHLNGRLTAAQVKDQVAISQEGLSNVASISATNRDQKLAALTATTFAQQFIAFRRDSDRSTILQASQLSLRQFKALSPTAQQSVQGKQLRQRIDQLQTLAGLQNGNAELVQPAEVPTSPSSPRTVRNTLVGAAFGVLLALVVALMADRLDRRIRDPEELQEAFDRPILAAIPLTRRLARGGPSLHVTHPTAGEAFRMLRANLQYFNVDRGLNSILVTSAAPGDGKSTVAANLAAAAAGAGMRVLLLEVDLRHPSLAPGLRIKPSPGLTHVLAKNISLGDVAQAVPVEDGGSAGSKSTRSMDVVVAGPLPPNPTDLLESRRMRDVLRHAERDYDLVVVDTPPTSIVSDAIPLVPHVSGVIVVGRLGKSTRDAMQHLRHQLDNLDAVTLGVVVNAVTRRSAGYGYGYGYGTSYAPDPEAVDESMAFAQEPATPEAAVTNGAPDPVRTPTPARSDGSPGTGDPAPRRDAPRPVAAAGGQPKAAPRRRSEGLISRFNPRRDRG